MTDRDVAPSVLMVCTGNLCRSPLAAALLERQLAEQEIATRVRSVGTAAPPGQAPDRRQLRVAEELGIDLATHRATPMTARHVADADLVLTMTAAHSAAVIAVDQNAGGRTLTLRAAAWRSAMIRGGPLPFADWVTRLTADVPVAERPRVDTVNDIPDPVGGPLREYRAVAAEVDSLVRALVKQWSAR